MAGKAGKMGKAGAKGAAGGAAKKADVPIPKNAAATQPPAEARHAERPRRAQSRGL